jgi:hypothetical protein
LKSKDKAPRSSHGLDVWIAQAERSLGSGGGRLGWLLIASTVAAAVLQQTLDTSAEPAFLLKGGSLLQHKFRAPTRTTTDVDGLVRGDIEEFMEGLDGLLAQPWGPFEFESGPVEVIEVPNKVVKPRRFQLFVKLNGQTWRRVQVELSPDEGRAGVVSERTPSPRLAGFGLPTPDHLASLTLRYQIAQKVHASTDPHDPPEYRNDRARDVVDLLLLRDLSDETGHPDKQSILDAILDIFAVRAAEAETMDRKPRPWPARLTACPHWRESYDNAAQAAGQAPVLADGDVGPPGRLCGLRRGEADPGGDQAEDEVAFPAGLAQEPGQADLVHGPRHRRHGAVAQPGAEADVGAVAVVRAAGLGAVVEDRLEGVDLGGQGLRQGCDGVGVDLAVLFPGLAQQHGLGRLLGAVFEPVRRRHSDNL